MHFLIGMEEKKCLECGRVFHGRADKVFCSDLCRNSYNNRKNRVDNQLFRTVNSVLKKNWKILSELNPQGKSKASREKLLQKGYNFSYMTDQYETKEKKKYIFCYDQGILDLQNGYYAIVKKKETLNK